MVATQRTARHLAMGLLREQFGANTEQRAVGRYTLTLRLSLTLSLSLSLSLSLTPTRWGVCSGRGAPTSRGGRRGWRRRRWRTLRPNPKPKPKPNPKPNTGAARRPHLGGGGDECED